MDSQLICDYYNMNLKREPDSKDCQQVREFFEKHCPEILNPPEIQDLNLLPDTVTDSKFQEFDLEGWVLGPTPQPDRISLDNPGEHFLSFQSHWQRIADLVDNFLDHRKLDGGDFRWLQDRLSRESLTTRPFLPEGFLMDQGMSDRPKVGYSRGFKLVGSKGKTIEGQVMADPEIRLPDGFIEFQEVSLDEYDLEYTEYFEVKSLDQLVPELVFRVNHQVVSILTKTMKVSRCAAIETPKRDKCRKLISHKMRPGPPRLYCTNRCKRRTYEHFKGDYPELCKYYVAEGYV